MKRINKIFLTLFLMVYLALPMVPGHPFSSIWDQDEALALSADPNPVGTNLSKNRSSRLIAAVVHGLADGSFQKMQRPSTSVSKR